MKFLNGVDFQNNTIDGVPNATTANQPVNKSQLDAAVQGWKWKQPVRAASTTNLTLSGTQTVDGVALIANDRILVKDQSTAANNGIYVVASGSWVRAVDADAASEISSMSVLVQEGTANADKQFNCTTNDPITLGSTAITYVQVGGGTSYTPGTGMSIASSVISVDTAVVARKVGADIGNGAATSFNISHNLGTTDAVVLIRETAGGKAEVEADVVFTDSNTVTVSFAVAPTTGQYRVTVIG